MLEGCRPRVFVEHGCMRDYEGLASFHYRSGPPAVVAGVRRAVMMEQVVGVLVLARPTLNGAWRSVAWPGEFEPKCCGGKRPAALRINRDLRTIARVVVDPRVRGLGIAAGLVRAYLERPDTPRTESIAAMAHACPFFASAGMTRIDRAEPACDARLRLRLSTHGVEPMDLVSPQKRDCALAFDGVVEAILRW